MICSPRPVSAREPGPWGTGTARLGSATAHSTHDPGCNRPSRIGRRGGRSPGQGRACRSALVSSSVTTIAMSSPRSAASHRCKVARVKSRAARTDPAPVSGVRVAIRGRSLRPAGQASDDGRPLPRVRPAVSAASISQRQSVLSAWCAGRTAVAVRPACATPRERRCGPAFIARVGRPRWSWRPSGRGGASAPAGWPRGWRAGRGARVTAALPGGAVTVHSRHPGGPGNGRVPIPQHDRAGDPEAGCGLLASGASQPAEGVDTPADADRAGADVGLAERCRIGMPGDAGTHLAPHDRHPQLVADHGPLGDLGGGAGLRGGPSAAPGASLGGGPGPRRRAGVGGDPDPARRTGVRGRPGRARGIGLGRRPGRARGIGLGRRPGRARGIGLGGRPGQVRRLASAGPLA